MKDNRIFTIHGQNDREVLNDLSKYIQRKYGFNKIYIDNAFIILLSHSMLEKSLKEIIYELVKDRQDKKCIEIEKGLSRMSFSDKIEILRSPELRSLFKKNSAFLAKLSCFNTMRNAFGHLYLPGHKAYTKFFQSYDISQKILTMGRYGKIAELQGRLEYILSKLKAR